MERLSDIMARVGHLAAARQVEQDASRLVVPTPPPVEKLATPLESAPPLDDATRTRPASGKVITISKYQRRQVESMVLAREERERGEQQLVFSSRPFVLCSLPVRRPQPGVLKHIRKNGKFFLRITGDVDLGLPFGQDRLIPIWVATLALRQGSRSIRFSSAAEILETFQLPKDGVHYRRLVEGFKRIFGSTIFFGTEEQLQAQAIFDWSRFHFFDHLQLWYTKQVAQQTLPCEEFENRIQLSEAFWNELQQHPIPIELRVVRALASSPALLDFYTWLVWRCWNAKGETAIPLFGSSGLLNQLGISEKTSARNFKIHVRQWLRKIKALWPECPVHLSTDSNALVINHAQAITTQLPEKLEKPAT